MKKLGKSLSLLLALGMTLTLVSGCGAKSGGSSKASGSTSGSGEIAAAKDQVFRYQKSSDTTGLNPIVCTTGPDNEVSAIIYEPLYRDVTNEKNESNQEPGSAKSYDVSEDGKTYTFHIRDNAVWTDGKPVTANDFEYTLKLMADPQERRHDRLAV
jgi:oligopeptide transport system substrate-binding protein